ncbi:hypothetical protein [Hydrogenimonas sp.]
MTTKIRNLSAVLLCVALLGGATVWGLLGSASLINFETGFFSAILVLAATTFGYWQMVQGSAESPSHHDLPCETERIDDRFGLWEESGEEEIADAVELFREEKRRARKGRRDFKTFLKTTKPALSLYRLGAYAVLVYAVFELISRGIFEPVPYLLGAGAAPAAAAVTLWVGNRS